MLQWHVYVNEVYMGIVEANWLTQVKPHEDAVLVRCEGNACWWP